MLIPTRHFSPTKLFVSREHRLVLMLNPKVLTTFTAHFLNDGFREFHGREDPSENRYVAFRAARKFPIAPLSDYYYFLRNPLDFNLFGFVRNPFGRLASAWKNKLLDGHNNSVDGRNAGYPRSIQKRHMQHMRQFAKRNNLSGSQPDTLILFDTFLRYISARREGKRDHHWDAQTRVLMVDRLDYKKIFRIESELEEGFQRIGGRLGFPGDWIADRLQDPQNRSSTTRPVFDAHLANIALPLCQTDLDFFGYSPQSWANF